MVGRIIRFFTAFKSLFIGLYITAKDFPQKAVTVRYPDEKRKSFPRFRGALMIKGAMGEQKLDYLTEGFRGYTSLVVQKDREDKLPPCTGGCPAGVDARGQNALISQGKFKEALDLVRDRNIIPGSLGRICHHPCEGKCHRGYFDQPIAIRPLHRVISEICYEQGESAPKPVSKTKDKRIAIIGSGPAGLTAAYDLAKLGYPVTIFEKEKNGGGALLTGVPKYRLPKDILQRDTDDILALGIEFKGGVEVGKDMQFDDIKKQGFDAVVIAAGLQISRGIPIPGADLKEGIIFALPFLKAVNLDQEITIGKRIIVIGGGNVAVDVARCVLRQSGVDEVNLACLESACEMPAFPWEIEEGKEEGVKINCSWGPVQILHENGKITGLELQQCTSVFDEEGRFSPKFDDQNKKVISGDTVIFAIGQGSELSFLEGTKVEVDERGRLIHDRNTLATSEDGVFACGEVVTGPGSAIGSITNGHEAAISIDRYLRGEDLAEGRVQKSGVEANYIDYPDLDVSSIEEERLRRPMPMRPPEERAKGFNQVELGFTKDDAIKEAERCLWCKSEICVGCGFCARTCPDYIISVDQKPAGDAERGVQDWDLDLKTCMFCGLCVETCPTRTLRHSDEFELDVRDKDLLSFNKDWMLRNRASIGSQDNKEEGK